jgi:hypothetical protein
LMTWDKGTLGCCYGFFLLIGVGNMFCFIKFKSFNTYLGFKFYKSL